jgi:hypothetical protein
MGGGRLLEAEAEVEEAHHPRQLAKDARGLQAHLPRREAAEVAEVAHYRQGGLRVYRMAVGEEEGNHCQDGQDGQDGPQNHHEGEGAHGDDGYCPDAHLHHEVCCQARFHPSRASYHLCQGHDEEDHDVRLGVRGVHPGDHEDGHAEEAEEEEGDSGKMEVGSEACHGDHGEAGRCRCRESCFRGEGKFRETRDVSQACHARLCDVGHDDRRADPQRNHLHPSCTHRTPWRRPSHCHI